MQSRSRWDLFVVSIWVIVACLAAATIYLGLHRLYQVDEMQNAYMARVQALGKQRELFTSAPLFIFPLAPLAHLFSRSADLISCYRMIFVGVFWLNIVLLVKASGQKLSSRTGAWLLLGAATLAPVWDYGFEVRHDNVIVCGVLLMWLWGKPHGAARKHAYTLLGAMAVTLQFAAFKSFLYWAPLTAAFLLLPHPAHTQARWKLWGRWLLGAGVALVLLRGLYGVLDLWQDFASTLASSSQIAHAVKPFDHTPTASRLMTQTPLLLALQLVLALLALHGLFTRRLAYFSWSSSLPEVLLVAGATAIFFVNPTPYRYNLVPLAAIGFLGAARLAPELQRLRAPRYAGVVAACVFAYAHLLPFERSTRRLFDFPNTRQQHVMDLAEAMTDPVKDRVYDASGLVLTRDSIGYHWFLHTLIMKNFSNGTFPTVRRMLAKNPASVFLPNYRTSWLPVPDRVFIAQHYQPLADDYWVLGGRLPAAGGSFACLHPGRYIVQHSAPGLTINGQPVSSDVVELAVGRARIESPQSHGLRVYWLGPRLQQLPEVGRGDHASIYNGEF
ncbi:MAG TPA: hypothetical protein VF331_12945 [Polyangiales bacterium]